ncbi:hypothetical protein C2G38_1401667 [Gigaspora rosea]|uniref:Protein argonaute N-terminal domain-containing protein n=1 Tax=Gigaspora rosea TaxID=44941 RepID=A0A397V8X5_9GLOM|nr:hypothetical protein C2G38_1401667 [Gigaspora rosea]
MTQYYPKKSCLWLLEFARRPGLGSFGRATRVRTNFFEVTSLPDGNIMHYDATITPDVPPALNRRIFQELERIYGATALAGARPVYDGLLTRVFFSFERAVSLPKFITTREI